MINRIARALHNDDIQEFNKIASKYKGSNCYTYKVVRSGNINYKYEQQGCCPGSCNIF
ncbi:MAG: hypothetical protein IJ590_02930 [Rickettsiales bacterium]|nr:hypothetical protein [Rickettsiales bacterium]